MLVVGLASLVHFIGHFILFSPQTHPRLRYILSPGYYWRITVLYNAPPFPHATGTRFKPTVPRRVDAFAVFEV